MTLEEAFSKYENELIYVRGRSPNTLKSYRETIFRFAGGLTELTDIFTVDRIASYLKLRQPNISPTHMAFESTVIRSFSKWAAKRRLMESDPLEDLPPYRYEKPPPRALRWTEAEAMVENASQGSSMSKRDYALLYFILHTGCRTGEAIGATVHDLDMESGRVVFVNTKGKKPRIVYLSKSLKEVLSRYIIWRNTLWPKSEWLFPSWRGEQLDKNALTDIKKRYGITSDISRFRATAATKLLQETKDLRLVQDVLGHSSIATTERYLTVWDDDKKRAAEAMDR